ncbi:EAL domain-containing protein [Sphingomonas ginsenosidivorax]|uniref:EAL domain-containing protein n=1 Tax=Sphingomonas ginsenosidivorax TaxID=862135 RepID=A0A5C6UA49_9SPHN|nr:EAL domain-containing protein [Sphingomonas ginsenosidivorax]TXC69654.1 EAL domain-containing protein [Sphingomonas ginsenosidivorax]
MKSIGTALVRIQVLGFVLYGLMTCGVLSAIYVSRSANLQHERHMQSLVTARQIAAILSDQHLAEAELVLHPDPRSGAIVLRNTQAVDARIAALKALADGPAAAADVAGFERSWDRYRTNARQWLASETALAQRASQSERSSIYRARLKVAHRDMDAAIDTLATGLMHSSKTMEDRAKFNGEMIILALFVLSVLGAVLKLLLLRYVREEVVGPLTDITRSLSDLAAGDLDVAVGGGERDDEVGALVRALEIFRRRARELEVAHCQTREAQAHADSLARNDILTGLPNRRQFVDSLMRATQDPAARCAVLLIDLKRFKPINEIHGYETGDMVLCELADRFVRHRNDLGVISRLGGDEFAVVVPIREGTDDAVAAGQRIRDIVVQPIDIAGSRLEVGATIGVALYPQDGANPSALLRAAGLALYRAKQEPGASCQLFEQSMQDRAQHRAFIDTELRRAIADGEIRPYYQPLVGIECGEVVGFEILARWHHPTRGIIMPDQFIAAADERGLLTDMTYQIFRRACEDARPWPSNLTLSLNLAPSQLSDPLLAARLKAILDQTGISPSRIEIEVTENALITDLDATKTLLLALRDLGMTISLDDFGTGYASLYQLRDLKFDKIKIDRSFVERIERMKQEGEGNILVRAMISLGKSLGLSTTAEGIQDPEQLASLADWGCDFGQGYLFGKAMTAAQAGQFVMKNSATLHRHSATGPIANTAR